MREEVLFENKRQIEGPGVLYEGNYYSGHAWHGKQPVVHFTNEGRKRWSSFASNISTLNAKEQNIFGRKIWNRSQLMSKVNVVNEI